MPTKSCIRSPLRVCADRARQDGTGPLPHQIPDTITIHPPTSDGDRAAFIAVLAAILVRVAHQRAEMEEAQAQRAA